MSEVFVPIDDNRVRLSDADLHRRACRAFFEGDQIVFQSLPGIISQIIENKTWKTFGKKSFADYALDATSNGLGVNTNQRLWMLRCAMDVHGAHIKEWADVLAKVEEMVRVEAAKDGVNIRSFGGNSLEMLAKNVDHAVHDKITYLPSQQKHDDGHLIRLRKNKPDIFKRVIRREITMIEARKEAGMKVARVTNVGRAQSAMRLMTEDERSDFIEWLASEGLTPEEKRQLKEMLE